MTAGSAVRANHFRELGQDVGYGVVGNGMDGVETQTVEAIFIQPVKCIVNEKIPDCSTLGSIKVDSIAHGV